MITGGPLRQVPSSPQPIGLGPPSLVLRERVPRVARRARVVAGVILCVFIAALAGCGKRNAPTPPPDAPDTYPRPYPSE